MKSINLLLLAVLSLFLLFGVNAATVSHPASEITPGTFPAGDFAFQGNVELQKNNEVFLNIRNTEASGRQYALVSAGSSGGIGVGKFSVYDKTSDTSRLTIDSSGNVGIGTANPTQKLDVAGYIRGSSGLCIGGDCRTGWPSGGITSESDPTVVASVKDGITWAEISSRPAGLDDGDQVGITSISASSGITLSPNPITTSGTIEANSRILDKVSGNLKVNAPYETTLYSFTVAANILGTDNALRLTIPFTAVSNANREGGWIYLTAKYGSAQIAGQYIDTSGTCDRYNPCIGSIELLLTANGATNSQEIFTRIIRYPLEAGGGLGQGSSAVDSTSAQNLVVSVGFAGGMAAGDYVERKYAILELLK
ncbi:MAG: hypothetical protein Q8R04_00055 [Nanoarchaeota archaeon]|nr:hypothetical protein [Nanoarchaeota archaeon]